MGKAGEGGLGPSGAFGGDERCGDRQRGRGKPQHEVQGRCAMGDLVADEHAGGDPGGQSNSYPEIAFEHATTVRRRLRLRNAPGNWTRVGIALMMDAYH